MQRDICSKDTHIHTIHSHMNGCTLYVCSSTWWKVLHGYMQFMPLIRAKPIYRTQKGIAM